MSQSVRLCECGHVEDQHDQKRFRFGPCGAPGCGCGQFSYADDLDVYDQVINQADGATHDEEDMNADNASSESGYRSSMIDAGRGHLL